MTKPSSVVTHTPGPWAVYTRNAPSQYGREDVREVTYIINRFSRAHHVPFDQIHPDKEHKANALIIAAAPEMFELLVKFMGAVAHNAPPEALEEYANEAHAVLKKAGAEL